jgi:hypothetical protein
LADDPDTTAIADGPSTEDLRRRAGELDIAGRSKMTAEQLAVAIDIAERAKASADAAIQTRTSVPPAGDEQRFPVSRLRGSPEILGHPVAVVAAAFADADVSDDDELTRSQAEVLIQRSQERPVEFEEA